MSIAIVRDGRHFYEVRGFCDGRDIFGAMMVLMAVIYMVKQWLLPGCLYVLKKSNSL
jgi:hypothetical protein